jgi:hypothetical protein
MGPDPENPSQLKWHYDRDAPPSNMEHTSMMPAVRDDAVHMDPEPDEFADVYEREDGSIYGRVDPAEFPDFDDVDSRTVPHVGEPG